MTNLPARQYQPLETSHTTPFSEPWLQSLAKGLGEVNGNPTLMQGVTVSNRQRDAIQTHLTRLKSRLSCGGQNRSEVAIELAKLFAAFPAQSQSDTPAELRMEAYFEALAGVPGWTVREARGRIIRGETTLNPSFMPTPPQMAELARAILEPIRSDLRRLEALATADANREPPPEERARVTEAFDKLKGEMRPKVSAHQVYEDAMAGLQKRARDNGVDFQAALNSIPNQPETSGTFRKLKSA